MIVAGSSGSYFHAADTVIQMKEYLPCDITDSARATAAAYGGVVSPAAGFRIPDFRRCPRPADSLREQDRLKIKVLGMEGIRSTALPPTCAFWNSWRTVSSSPHWPICWSMPPAI